MISPIIFMPMFSPIATQGTGIILLPLVLLKLAIVILAFISLIPDWDEEKQQPRKFIRLCNRFFDADCFAWRIVLLMLLALGLGFVLQFMIM